VLEDELASFPRPKEAEAGSKMAPFDGCTANAPNANNEGFV